MTIWLPTVALQLAGLLDPGRYPGLIRTPEAGGHGEPTTLVSGQRRAIVALVTELYGLANSDEPIRAGDRVLYRLAVAFAMLQGIEPSDRNRDSDAPL